MFSALVDRPTQLPLACGMKSVFVLALLMGAPVAILGQSAQEESNQPLLVRAPGETLVPGKCIFKEDLDLIAARRDLKRTTLNNDAEAPFDPDYLVGQWNFEYETSESALGQGGQVSGTETVQHAEGCLYEGTTQAKGPDGAFTVKSTMVYDPSAHYMLVLERDSRGFEVLKYGRVGGDSGGFYTHHWQTAPFTVHGNKLSLKGSTLMSSPVNYRVRTEISEGGGPFVNLGTLWMKRQGTAGGK
jgi:hypothetical protein